MRVLVCDDKPEQCKQTVQDINSLGIQAIDVEFLSPDELTTELTDFFAEISRHEGQAPAGSKFDEIDIVLLDNNLSALKIKGARLTAEAIAGYIRAYSTAKYIVSLNKNPEIDFDLRYLVGDYSTIADLALNSNHLKNKALWTGNPDDSENRFKPWYWPALLNEPDRRRDQITFVGEHLDVPVLDAFEVPPSTASYISRHATGILSPMARYDATNEVASIPGVEVGEITFRDFFLSRNRSLPDRNELRGLSEAVPVNSTEPKINCEIISRVVASDIDLWIRRDLLAPQDAVIDLPHLLVRMPFLLGSQSSDRASWDSATQISRPPFGLDRNLFTEHLKEAMIKKEMWAMSPIFSWSTLRDDDELNRMFFESKNPWADLVFCEDISRFELRSSQDDSSPVEFEAEFEGSWTRRFVSRIDGVNYAPRSRFAR